MPDTPAAKDWTKHPAVKVLGSIWFLLPLLLGQLVVCILGSTDWGLDKTIGAIRKDLYAPAFNILLGLMAVNLVVCTLKRKPYKVWMWGFLCTHTGVMIIMVGSYLSYNHKIYGQMGVPEGESRSTFDIEDERELLVGPGGGAKFQRLDIRESLYEPSEPKLRWEVPGQDVVVHVDRYLHHREFRPPKYPHYENVGDASNPMACFEIFLNDQSQGQEFVAENQQVQGTAGQLIVLFRTTSDAEAEKLTRPIGERGRLMLRFGGGEEHHVDVAEALGKAQKAGDAEVTVQDWFEDYSVTADHKVERSPDAGTGPAVIFQVKQGTSVETYAAFARAPDQSPWRIGHGRADGFDARLQPRLQVSAMVFFKSPSGWRYMISSRKGDFEGGRCEVGQKIRFPFMPFKLEVRLKEFLDRAEPVPIPRGLEKDDQHSPAVLVRLEDKGGNRAKGWVFFREEPRRFALGEKRIQVGFFPKTYDLKMDLELVKFRKMDHPGTRDAKSFESDVKLNDGGRGITRESTIRVNQPLVYQGWVFYQAAYNDSGPKPVSFYQVSFDPGKKVVYLGVLVTVAGSIYMFYFRTFLMSLMQGLLTAKDVPLGSGAQMGWLVLGTSGTLLGFALAAFSSLPLLAVTGLVLLFDSAGLWIIAATARRRSAGERKGAGAQMAQLFAIAWLVNTAGLSVTLLTQAA
jgi:hypothetical protein